MAIQESRTNAFQRLGRPDRRPKRLWIATSPFGLLAMTVGMAHGVAVIFLAPRPRLTPSKRTFVTRKSKYRDPLVCSKLAERRGQPAEKGSESKSLSRSTPAARAFEPHRAIAPHEADGGRAQAPEASGNRRRGGQPG